jgi:hypothetical protein
MPPDSLVNLATLAKGRLGAYRVLHEKTLAKPVTTVLVWSGDNACGTSFG